MKTLRTCFLGLTVLAAVSCAQDPLDSQTVTEQGREALVGLSLRAVPQSAGMPGSRAVTEEIEEGTDAAYKVSDFWLLEYNDRGLMIGSPHYYVMSEFTDGTAVPIILPPAGSEYTCVVLANTHADGFSATLGEATTLDKLKTFCKNIRTQEDTYNAGTRDLLMNCVVPVTSNTTTLDCQLYRNIAKLTLRLTNREGSDVQINSVQLRNVPDRQFYADRLYADAPAPSPAAAEAGFIDWDVEECAIAAGEPTKELVFYLPRNCRGVTGSVLESQKNVDAPFYATFLEIMAEDVTRHTPLRYRFYLGRNMKNDFNIIPNHHYVLPITINDKGDASTDNRVEDMGEVELAESNSYLINPLKGEVQTLYAVPITRINRFWGNEGPDKSAPIASATEWVAEVIWQDRPARLIDFCSPEGLAAEGNTTYEGKGESFFYFKPLEGASGNVVIGVRKKAASKREYLWSWHLWITDYAPEYTTAWKEGVYAYPVEGGSVHRYPGNSSGTHIWDTKYRNKYIMDRNLGAFAANSSGGRNAYGFYYQFGRKDPFPHSGTALYDIEGNPQQDFTTSPDDCIQRIQGQAYLYEGVQLPYGFYYPGSNDWVKGNPYSATSRLWNNPTWHTSDSNKSFFDPCPPGWKLPETGTWGTLSKTNSAGWRNGYEFYMKPGGAEGDDVTWYPASGLRNIGSGAVNSEWYYGYYWSSAPVSATNAYSLYFYSGGVNPQNNLQRGNGFPVRCVQE